MAESSFSPRLFSPAMEELLKSELAKIWSSASYYLGQELALYQAVRIPGLGSFTVVRETVVSQQKGPVVVDRPVFHLAKALAQDHDLLYDSIDVPAPLPAPKPMVISLLVEGEEPWIPDLGSPEAVAGDVSPGRLCNGPGSARRKELREILVQSSSLSRAMRAAAVQTAASGPGLLAGLQEQKIPEVPSAALRREWLLAITGGNSDNILKLLEQDPSLMSVADHVMGFTALHWLAKHGQQKTFTEVISRIHEKGCAISVDTRTPKAGLTPLHNHMSSVSDITLGKDTKLQTKPPLPAPNPMVISLLEEGEEPWIPDVGSPEAVAGDVSPAGAGIRNPRKGLQEGGVVNRQCGSIDMEEMRRDVHVDQEQGQGEHNKSQRGKHLLKASGNPQDLSTDPSLDFLSQHLLDDKGKPEIAHAAPDTPPPEMSYMASTSSFPPPPHLG
ncbi:UNVERIFIED_CONTAM: hypothetical protein H355_005992 [Colinus virginianus]|nr:hypothetical protein H355_005992 [Colinus virginianus]